jgi:hypothetical protein
MVGRKKKAKKGFRRGGRRKQRRPAGRGSED